MPKPNVQKKCLLLLCHLKTLEHLLISCPFTNMFWLDFIIWCRNVNIELEELNEIDKLFGVSNRREDFMLLNHLLLLSKKRNTSTNAAEITPVHPFKFF